MSRWRGSIKKLHLRVHNDFFLLARTRSSEAFFFRWDEMGGFGRERKKSKTDFFINYDFCEFFSVFFLHRRWWRRERVRNASEMMSNAMLAWCISAFIGQVWLKINNIAFHDQSAMSFVRELLNIPWFYEWNFSSNPFSLKRCGQVLFLE